MNTNTDTEPDHLDDQLRRLVAEMVAQAPSVDEVTTTPVLRTTEQAHRPRQWVTTSAAAALLLIALVGGWWLAKPDVATVSTDFASSAPITEQPYRWSATSLDGEVTYEGAVDPALDRARVRVQLEGEFLEFLDDGTIVGIRYEGDGSLVAIFDEDELERLVGRWFLFGPSERDADVLRLDDLRTLGGFDVDVWEDLGFEVIDGVETEHIRATNQSGDERQEGLVELAGFAGLPWDGNFDVWLRDDGAIAQIVLFHTPDGELRESMRINLFDYGVPVDISFPDNNPPTELFEISGEDPFEDSPPPELSEFEDEDEFEDELPE